MPISRYDSLLGNARKVYTNMQKQYGPDKGERVFYATINKRKKRLRRTNGS